jgi:adenylylsulfate kinase
VDVAVLEADALRRVFTPHPTYSEEERDLFYGAMVHIGRLLTEHGVPVIFDATGNRRNYRDRARLQIPRLIEVYVDCPLSICMKRDPKGIYRKAREGTATTVPGLQAVYEPPAHPEVVVKGDQENPEIAAQRVIEKLLERGYVVP